MTELAEFDLNRLESPSAWRELLGTLEHLDETFLAGDRAVSDDRHVADGYRAIATHLGIALDTYLFAERSRPVWVGLNSPSRRDRRWGGDNTDAFYWVCPIDEQRRYRISGNKGDSVYLSITAYNEPSLGAWSDKIVALIRDTDIAFDANGDFAVDIGPIPGASVLLTRDYHADPIHGVPATWQIDALDHPNPVRHGDHETAASLRAVAEWIRTMHAIIPLTVGVRPSEHHALGHEPTGAANEMGTPYEIEDTNYGWSARDAAYSFGSFDLTDDEALVITHRPPVCRFWNFTIWNQYMATHNASDGRLSVNNSTASTNPDGSVTIVVSKRRVDHPNSLTTLEYPRGILAFRWFLASALPERPVARLVDIADLADLAE